MWSLSLCISPSLPPPLSLSLPFPAHTHTLALALLPISFAAKHIILCKANGGSKRQQGLKPKQHQRRDAKPVFQSKPVNKREIKTNTHTPLSVGVHVRVRVCLPIKPPGLLPMTWWWKMLEKVQRSTQEGTSKGTHTRTHQTNQTQLIHQAHTTHTQLTHKFASRERRKSPRLMAQPSPSSQTVRVCQASSFLCDLGQVYKD